MSTTEIFVLLIGILASASLIISSLSTERSRLLSFSLVCSALSVVQFILVDAFVAAAVITVGIVRNSLLLLSIKKERFAWLGSWPVMVAFMVIASSVWALIMDWNHFEWLSVIPIAGNILASVAVFFKNLIYTKSIFMAAGVMWFFYQFSYGAYGALIGETANFVSNGIALTILVRAAIAGKAPIDPTTEVIKTITTAIPAVTSAITTAIPVITSSTQTLKRGPLAEAGEMGTGSSPAVK